jgi:hypothetical protein
MIYFESLFEHSRKVLHSITICVAVLKLHESPLWSSGQSFWLQIQRSWVRFPALPDFLRRRGSETEPAQPREDN